MKLLLVLKRKFKRSFSYIMLRTRINMKDIMFEKCPFHIHVFILRICMTYEKKNAIFCKYT